MATIIVIDPVNAPNEDRIQDHHEEDPYAILDARIPHNPLMAAGDQDRHQRTG